MYIIYDHISLDMSNASRTCPCCCPRTCIPPPMCGSNGETYCDLCQFRCAQSKDPSLVLKHIGDCEDIDSFEGYFDEGQTLET